MRFVVILISLIVAIESTKSRRVCHLPKFVGPCRAARLRWYYDRNARKCLRFKYGGCQANGNNFVSKEQCQNECERRRPGPWVCRLPKKAGPCYAAMPRWYYDRNTGQCMEFTYGGCKPNGNNFKSLMDCQKTCLGRRVCHLPKFVGPCRAAKRRWYYDRNARKCLTFRYGGCGANGNNFVSKEQCQKECERRRPERCEGGKVRTKCATTCPPTCDNLNPTCNRACIIDGCECPPEKPFWSKKLRKCTNKCWCKGGMVIYICTGHCAPTCENLTPPCAKICSPPKCACPRDKPRWSNSQKKCLPCPKCQGGMVWKECASFCPVTCSHPAPDCNTKRCAPAQCQCPKYRPMWSEEKKKCATATTCGSKCTGGMIWRRCASHCYPTCKNPSPMCILSCAPGRCQCPPGKRIYSQSQQRCISVDMCPK